MLLSSIKGQASALGILQRDLVQKRFAHAYLFVGPDGVGKATAARALAGAIFCQKSDGEACGECLACRKFAHGNHPDFKKITSEKESLGIDIIRELKREIGYKPLESSRKVYLLADAHLLTPEAANSLLKTLEEPPSFITIILTAPADKLLLPTIVSRCRVIKFNPLPENIIEEYLAEEMEVEAGEAAMLASLASGSLGRAITYFQEDGLLEKRREILSGLQGLAAADPLEVMELVKKTMETGEELGWDFIFNLLQGWYRDVLLARTGDDENILNRDFLQELRFQAKEYNQEKLAGIINKIQDTYNLINRNIFKQLALEVMFLKIR